MPRIAKRAIFAVVNAIAATLPPVAVAGHTVAFPACGVATVEDLRVDVMGDRIISYGSRNFAADDFDFIARRMKQMDVPADYDLGGAKPDAGYTGPIVEDTRDIGYKLRALEASKRCPPAAPNPPVTAEPADDGWCCC